ncbi:MAG TPA: SgcJ/EcaC family oxidoreductase [Isosphaeraceae bacterium]
MRTASIAIGLGLVGTCLALRAQEAPAPARAGAAAKTSADEQAIAALVAAFTKAFNAGDADAAAATYAENALVVDEDGERTEGREAIRARLAAAFAANKGTTIAIKADPVHFLGPDTALEEGRTIITPAGTGAVPESTRFTVLYMKRDGRWLQSAVRDVPADDLTPHDSLKELEWLVGEWMNESQDAVVETTCTWSKDGNFLIREFTMKTQGNPVLSGTQRIGWDPVRHQLKMWVFDSEGGFGEGYWTRDGDRWVIKAEGVRQDGKHASATIIITKLGKDRASWQSTGRTIGGAAVPGVDEFTIVRKAPEPGK